MTVENQITSMNLSPAEMYLKAEEIAVAKSNYSISRLLISGVLAGAYIAFGAVFSSISITGMSGVWPYGFIRVIAGVTFSLGLILVVVGGAELFTGNNLMIIGYLDHKITLSDLLRNWFFVYIGNFLGSILMVVLVIYSRIYTASNGDLGKTMLSIAVSKTHFSFLQALILGILCNTLVCLAVWLSYSTSNTSGKILAILFPISAFIAAGFEHSVANMYSIPLGVLLKIIDPLFSVGTKLDLTTLTWGNFFAANLLPVTIGNIIGGAGFVGVLYFMIYTRK